MVKSICVPYSTLEVLLKNKHNIEFISYDKDFWYIIKLTKEIADEIIKNKLEWRYNFFDFLL